VDRPDIVWVTKVREMEEVQKQLAIAVMVSLPIEEVKVGTVAACKFSGDGEVYRCQVVAMEVEEQDLVMVRYMDFGNIEKVKKSELCHLPSSLCKMGPVAVRVRVGGMEGVKDNERNRARVEKKLGIEELEVSLNREGFAIFYDNCRLITFKGSKSRVDSEKESEAIQVEKNLRLEDMKEAPVEQTFVTDVELGCLEEVSVNEIRSVEKGMTQEHEMNLKKEENLVLGETATNRLDKVAVGDDSEVKESEHFLDCSNNSIKIIVEEVESRGASVPDHEFINNPEPTEGSIDNTNASLDDKADKSSGFTDDTSVDGASVSCETVAVGKEYVKKSDAAFSEASSGIGTDEALADDDNDNSKVVKTDDNLRAVDILADITDNSGQHCETPFEKPTEEDMSPKAKAECKNNIDGSRVGQKTGVSSSSSGRSNLRLPVISKKKTVAKPKRSSSGWQIGDEVVAQWVEDGVWRQGTVHEIAGDMAYVVCKEQLVRAARVRLDKLRHPTMPVEVLNMLEEEMVRDCEEEESLGESTTDVSSSIQKVFEEVNQEQFSDELEDLLALLPSVDIDMLTSPSCSDLLESLVMMIPSLPLTQVDRLVDGMMRQDLLIPVALHPSAYPLATQLVKYLMVANSNMKGQVMNCLARQADKMQRNIWGREVLRTLHGYI